MLKRKAPSSESNPNHDFCEFLTELADYERNVSRNVHKERVYRKAASTLSHHPLRIKSGEEAKSLPGIGDKIGKKIDEFLQTGKLLKLEKIHNDSDASAIRDLARVSGIGPVKAAELVKSGVKDVADLANHMAKLNHHQKLGLRYLSDFEQRIPRKEISHIESLVVKFCKSVDDFYQATVCGSYRRGAETSGDIDVLLTHPSHVSTKKKDKSEQKKLLSAVVSSLTKNGLVTDSISLGDTKFMGVCRLGEDYMGTSQDGCSSQGSAHLPYRRLDIRLIPMDQYHCGVLYFTGSDLFNQSMRQEAITKGFTLNEYCLRPLGITGVPGEALPIESEQDVFDYLDMDYKEPHERNM